MKPLRELRVRFAVPSFSGTEPQDPPDVRFRTAGRPQHGMEVSVTAPAGETVRIEEGGGFEPASQFLTRSRIMYGAGPAGIARSLPPGR